jgi:hypothetical protein
MCFNSYTIFCRRRNGSYYEKLPLYVTEKLPVPPILGRRRTDLYRGCPSVLSRQHEISVFCLRNEALPDEEEKNGVKYIRVAGKDRSEICAKYSA